MIKFIIGRSMNWNLWRKDRECAIWVNCKDKSILLEGIGGVRQPYPSIGIKLSRENIDALKEMVAYAEEQIME